MGNDATSEDDRLAELFERALEVPPGERPAFLEEACGGDERLRDELTSLLASHDAAPDFLDGLGSEVLPTALDALDARDGLVGETIGHYEVRERLGAGGMGEVYRARDLELGRDVALKFLSPHLATDGPARERLRHEARVASGLDHPNIAVVYEIGTASSAPGQPVPRTYIAQAYCGRRTLANELESAGPLPLERVLDCSIQLADALSAAHEAGVVHRDVKPANLIVTDQGSVKLIDFGLATRVGGPDGRAARGGTIAYMSPEQLTAGDVDFRTDIWAAGVVLYEMLTGSRPFEGAGADQLAEAIRHGQPPSVLATRPDVPPRLAAVVRRCLARDPASRYASATALLTDLRTAADTRLEGGGPTSLVVLPFDDASDDSPEDYLGDGFTEEIIADLSRVRALRVIAGASSRRLRGVGGDAAAAARQLGVRHALHGSLEVRAGSLRVTASLVDARTGARSWSTTIEGADGELLGVRREIARSVVGRLGLPFDAREPAATPIAEPPAYEAYLRARHEAWSFSADGLERARRYIDAALGIVGDNDLLYGMLGRIAVMRAESGLHGSMDAALEAERFAHAVFALNPRSAKGHWLKAWAAFRRGDLHGAIRSGEHAHALESDDPDVLLLLGYVYAHADRNADARALFERALLLDPLTPLTQGVQGFVPILEGRFDEAVETYRRAHEMDPDSPFCATFHGWALAYDRRVDEATAVLDDVADGFPDTVFASLARSLAHGLNGRSDEATEAITPAFVAAGRDNEMFARELAHCHALAGDREQAFRWLARAVDLGMWNHAYLAEHDRFLDGLRSDPRFPALLERARRARARL